MSYYKIGVLVNTHGIRGEVKIKNFTDEMERFDELEYLYLDSESGMKRFDIENVRYLKNLVVVKFENYDNINDVERFKGIDIYIDETQLRELPDDTYHVFDLVGLVVKDRGHEIGVLVDVNQNAYQDIYLVKTSQGKVVQIPAVKNFVKSIDLESGTMEVELIEGML